MINTFAARSVPPERDVDPPPAPEIERLAQERAALLRQARRGVRAERQVRISRRIAKITRTLLTMETDR